MSNNVEVMPVQKAPPAIQPVYCYVPTQKLQQFVRALLSEECSGNKFKAEKISGVSKGLFYHKIKDPAFREWFSRQCDEALQAYEGAAASALIRRVKKGETAAIKLFYELLGKVKGAAGIGVAIQNTIVQGTVCHGEDLTSDELRQIKDALDFRLILDDKGVKDEDIPQDKMQLLFFIIEARPELVRKILDGTIKRPQGEH